MTDTLMLAVILVPCLVIAIVFHEVAHGYAALALGDPTAKEKRRLSLNPLRHVDPIGTIAVPGALALFGGPVFGWAKPVPVRQDRLDNPRFGMMAVGAAGPASNLVLAFFGAIALGLVLPENYGLVLTSGGVPNMIDGNGVFQPFATGLFFFILINIFLALFNLLPIPPFDGSHVVGGLLPRNIAHHWQKLQAMGMLLLLILIAVTWAFPENSVIADFVFPPVLWLQDKYLAVADWVAAA